MIEILERIPAEPVQWLVVQALNELYRATQDPDRGGCCWQCCGPCSALKTFLDIGLLDQLVHPYWSQGWWTDPDTGEAHRATAWWDPDAGCVDRAWLLPALEAAPDHEHAKSG